MITVSKSKVLDYLKNTPYELYPFSNGEMLVIRFKGKNELDTLVKGLKSIGVDVNDNDCVIASDRMMLWFRTHDHDNVGIGE
jgi:hypothetical protein